MHFHEFFACSLSLATVPFNWFENNKLILFPNLNDNRHIRRYSQHQTS